MNQNICYAISNTIAGVGLPTPGKFSVLKMLMFLVIIFLLGTSSLFSNKYHWDSVYSEPTSDVVSIDNADSMNIMAYFSNYGAFRLILKSSDAGINWKSVYSDTTLLVSKMVTPRDIAYPTKDFCIATSDENYYITTTNGGETWKEYRIDTLIEEFGLQHVSMYNDRHGIITSRHFMYISADGFETWRQVALPGWYTITTIFMISPDILTFIGIVYDGSPNYDEKFLKSTDAGKTWVEYPYPDHKFPDRLRFVDSLNGFVAGSDQIIGGSRYADLIYKTTDGGESWHNMLDTICWSPFGLQDMDMFDNDNGIAVGQFGKIYWTHDGGNTWERDSNALIYKQTPATMRTCMLGKNTALIGDFNNRIFRSSLIPDGVVEREVVADEFSIMPNPAEEYIEITGINPTLKRGVEVVQIFNVFGEKIPPRLTSSATPQEGNLLLDVSMLPSGVYFVRVGDKVGKFVKL